MKNSKRILLGPTVTDEVANYKNKDELSSNSNNMHHACPFGYFIFQRGRCKLKIMNMMHIVVYTLLHCPLLLFLWTAF